MSKNRLLEVNVQAVLVEDDSLRKHVTSVVTVPAADWQAFVADGGGFDQNIAQVDAELTALKATEDEPAQPSQPSPRRSRVHPKR